MKFNAVIFDLDGTLLNTLEDIGNAGNAMLTQYGFPIHSTDDYRTFVGDGVEILTRRILPEKELTQDAVNEYVSAFRKAYSKHWQIKTKPYEGISEMLDHLADLGLPLAILSNKPEDFTKKCVDKFLSRWNFEYVRGAREGIPRKPDPEVALNIADDLKLSPGEIIYAGDTSVDMKTGNAAGMFTVGVCWGFRAEKELLENGAQHIIHQPGDLIKIILRGCPRIGIFSKIKASEKNYRRHMLDIPRIFF